MHTFVAPQGKLGITYAPAWSVRMPANFMVVARSRRGNRRRPVFTCWHPVHVHHWQLRSPRAVSYIVCRIADLWRQSTHLRAAWRDEVRCVNSTYIDHLQFDGVYRCEVQSIVWRTFSHKWSNLLKVTCFIHRRCNATINTGLWHGNYRCNRSLQQLQQLQRLQQQSMITV